MNTINVLSEQTAVMMPIIARRILFDFFNEVNIPQSQILTIMAIYEREPCRLSDLSQKMNVSAPTITGLVDRLEAAGYVKRTPNEEDRRVTNVTLTRKGRSIAVKFRTTVSNKWQEIFSTMGRKEVEDFVMMLEKIRSTLV